MPRISEKSIEDVAAATDIVALIGAYFPLKRAGTSYRALCPFHNEKTPSFHVNPDRQSYHCFGCHAGGSVFRFVMDYEHIDFPEAVRRLAARANITLIEEAGNSPETRHGELRRRLLAIHFEAAEWFHKNLLKEASAEPARTYLKSRDFDSNVAKDWKLGWAPDSWDALVEALREKKFTNQEIEASGLVTKKEGSNNFYARFRGRLMFPIRNDYGEVVAFSGRILDADAKSAKYVNSPETSIFTKGRILFALDKSKREIIKADNAIVCEGQIDTIRVFEAGIGNVIAPQGTAFTPEQARIVARLASSVSLCFDADRAGQEAITRSLPALFEAGLAVTVVALPAGHDPDSFIRSEGAEAFRALLSAAPDFFDYAVDKAIGIGALSKPHLLDAALRRLATHLMLISNAILRDAHIQKIASRLNVSPSDIAEIVRKTKLPQTTASSASENNEPTENFILAPNIETLCRAAMLSMEARQWLAKQDIALLQDTQERGIPLLNAIVAYEQPLTAATAQATFAASLPAEQERAFANMNLATHEEDDFLQICRSTWFGSILIRKTHRRAAIQNRLRDPALAESEITALQQNIATLNQEVQKLEKSRKDC